MRKRITRQTLNAIKVGDTLANNIEKGIISISSWFDLSVLLIKTESYTFFLSKCIQNMWYQNTCLKKVTEVSNMRK